MSRSIVILGLFLLLIPTLLYGAEPVIPLLFYAQNIIFEEENNLLIGRGKVKIEYEAMRLEADNVELYLKEEIIVAKGNVTFWEDQQEIRGDALLYNLKTKIGTVQGASTYMKPWHLSGVRIDKFAEKKLSISKGSFTTCDLPKPHYRLRAGRILIYLQERIVATNLFLYVGNIPIFYLPFYAQSLKEGRPAIPLHLRLGQSTEKGYYIKSDYYYGEKFRGSTHLDYYTKKGVGVGFTQHYDLGEAAQGGLFAYALKEKDTKEWRGESQLRHQGELAKDLRVLADFHFLSDKDFNTEYDRNPFGGIGDYLESYLNLTKLWPSFSLGLEANQKVDLAFTEKNALQRLPELSLYGVKEPILGSSYYYGMDSHFTYFTRGTSKLDGSLVNCYGGEENLTRADSRLSLFKSIKLTPLLTLSPALGYRGTWYNKNIETPQSSWREIYDGEVEANMRLYRYLRVRPEGRWERMRYLLEPALSYSFRPEVDQSKLYRYDALDQIPPLNYLALKLYNKLQGKPRKDDKGRSIDLLFLKVGSGCDLNKAREKFSDVLSTFEVNPTENFSFGLDSIFNPYWGEFTKLNTDVRLRSPNKWWTEFGTRYYRYLTEGLKEKYYDLYGQGALRLGKVCEISARERYDFKNKTFKEQEYTLYRDLHCWEAQVTWHQRETEKEFWFLIRLKEVPGTKLLLRRGRERWSFEGWEF